MANDNKPRRAVYEPQQVMPLTPERAREVGAEGSEWRRELNQRLDRLDALRPEDFDIRTR